MTNYRPRIHCLIPNAVDATSLYRATGPLSKLKHHIDCQFLFDTNVSWASLAWADILFIQRPWGTAFYKACQIAINNNVPIWVDYDDYLLDIPDWNPHKKQFQDPKAKKELEEILEMATVITVTTDKLVEKFKKHNENVFVIPNAIDDYLFPFEFVPSNNKIINWRGSATHSEDLRTVLPKIADIQRTKKYLDWSWNFIGKDAENLRAWGIHYKYQQGVDPIEYFHMIKELNPRIQIVPLVNHEFNEAKSNIGWLEGIYSGAVCVAPKYLKEFNRPGCLLYDDEADFQSIMENLMSCDSKEIRQIYEHGYNFIKQYLLLSEVNKYRKQVVEQLMDLKGKK